jgi:hypothetical protein
MKFDVYIGKAYSINFVCNIVRRQQIQNVSRKKRFEVMYMADRFNTRIINTHAKLLRIV